jgi:hypothetical protein
MEPVVFLVGFATIDPPVAALYQTIVAPAGAVAVAVRVWMGEVSQTTWLPPEVGAAGAGLMVSVTAVRFKLSQLVVVFFEAA